jgi:hypothetical protein
LPGTSAVEAARIVAGELPDFVHVVELPGRGPGADLAGRTGAMLARVADDLGLETTPTGWRIAGSYGRQMRRAASWLDEDLDALEETTQAYRGPVKGQICGPWTFAGAVELGGGERLLRDPGAVRDVAGALAEAASAIVGELRRRVPGASAIVVQVDEPGLRAVLDGSIGTASGLSAYAAVDPQIAGQVLTRVFESITRAGGVPAAHCCATRPPIDLLRTAGATAIGVDLLEAVAPETEAELGAAIEAGTGLLAGVVPSLGAGTLSDTRASAPVRGLLHRLGMDDDRWLAQVAVTPTCGLAGASPDWVRTALSSCRAVGRVLRDEGTQPQA